MEPDTHAEAADRLLTAYTSGVVHRTNCVGGRTPTRASATARPMRWAHSAGSGNSDAGVDC